MVSKNKKVGVLYGGLSSEREISFKTGRAFVNALEKRGYSVVPLEVGRNIVSELLKNRIDIAVNGLHGKLGEDGTVQGLLECLAIPYTGSGVMASAIAMNKILTKKIAQTENIETPPFLVCDARDLSKDSMAEFEKKIKYPVVVKAQAEGSTRGTVIVKDKKKLKEAIQEATQYDNHILVETFIDGPQITVGILKGRALPIIEIIPKGGFFDYYSKYTKGATDYIIPARVSKKTASLAQEVSLKIFHVLQCRGYARADFMVDRKGTPWFIEINTLPGMTETSLVPMAAAQVGISFEELVEEILSTAALDHEKIYSK